MYVQHPYKFDGKYYAKIDGNFYEISKEVAMAMLSSYRKEIYRSLKWAPEDDSEETEKKLQEEENILEQLGELTDDAEECAGVDGTEEGMKPVMTPKKKWKRKTKYVEILDCAFSENADGLSVADLPDESRKSVEETVIIRAEEEVLHKLIRHLSEQEQFIIRSVYFEDRQQKDVAAQLGMSKQLLHKRLQMIYRKLRKLYQTEKF